MSAYNIANAPWVAGLDVIVIKVARSVYRAGGQVWKRRRGVCRSGNR